ncbi:PhoH family protein [Carnobacterium sp. CS13]|nr:PhoH family protein [Carnobacterium sp. CS13]
MEVVINSRGDRVEIIGTEKQANLTEKILTQLQELFERGIRISQTDVVTAIKMAQNGTLNYFISMYEEEIGKDFTGKPIRAKNFGQREYVQSVKKHDIVFGIGPAGTGKTYLAVVMAIAALKKGEVKKIILTRPAVEAGENLGFLPGDLKEKVDPYLRPIYDALYSLFGIEHTARLMDRGVIEIAPLAYMRGRTLDDAFVILDEAQNTTISQMKMFLTRLGFGSKMIINGDVTQIDLPRGAQSGLIHAEKILRNVKNIDFVYFDSKDVVRHPVVASIIEAYSAEKEEALLSQKDSTE